MKSHIFALLYGVVFAYLFLGLLLYTFGFLSIFFPILDSRSAFQISIISFQVMFLVVFLRLSFTLREGKPELALMFRYAAIVVVPSIWIVYAVSQF